MHQQPHHQNHDRRAGRTLFANLTNGRLRLLLLMSVLVGLGLVLTACGGSDSDSTASDPFTSSTGAWPGGSKKPLPTPTASTGTTVVLSRSSCSTPSVKKAGDTEENPVTAEKFGVVSWTSYYNRQRWDRCKIYVTDDAKVRFTNSSDTVRTICKEETKTVGTGPKGPQVLTNKQCQTVKPKTSFTWQFEGNSDTTKVYMKYDGPTGKGVDVFVVAPPPAPQPSGKGTQSDPLLLGKTYTVHYSGTAVANPVTIFAVGYANISVFSRGSCTGITRTVRVLKNGSGGGSKAIACGQHGYFTLKQAGSFFTTFVLYEDIDNKPNVLATVIVTPE
jgi:hypothetical protein